MAPPNISKVNQTNNTQTQAPPTAAKINGKTVVVVDQKNPSIGAKFGRAIILILKFIACFVCPIYGIYKIYEVTRKKESVAPSRVTIVPVENKSSQKAMLASLAATAATIAAIIVYSKESIPVSPPLQLNLLLLQLEES